MWIWAAVGSAFLLGFYDVAKKQACLRNDVLHILFLATGLSALFFLPMAVSSAFDLGLADGSVFESNQGSLRDHLLILLKAVIVSTSWITGLMGLKRLPITTASTIKASRPMFVLLGSIVIFGERPNEWQWVGIIMALVALWVLGRTSKQEGFDFTRNKWVYCMWAAVITGVISALYDKYLMVDMKPMFVQSWCNIYITAIMGVILLAGRIGKMEWYTPYKHDWVIWAIALLITASDFLYFLSLSYPDSMLSIISMLRRSSVIITFVCGAILFHEKHLQSKGLALAILLASMAILVFASR